MQLRDTATATATVDTEIPDGDGAGENVIHSGLAQLQLLRPDDQCGQPMEGRKRGETRQPESLPERNFIRRTINNLQATYSLQVIDSSFEGMYRRQAPEAAFFFIGGTLTANERIIMVTALESHYSAPLARIQNDGMLGLSEYDRQLRNA